MPNFSGLDGKKIELIRKPLAGSLFIGESTAAVIATLTDATTSLLVTFPSTGGGYSDGGCFTDEGLRFARAVTQDEVTSFGFNTPTRTDITSDVESFQVDFQETNKRTISLFTGADPASLVPASNGEMKIDKPNVVSPRRYRALALSVDGPPEAEIYIGRFYPRVAVTDYADQAYAKGNELRWGCSFRAEKDTTIGTSLRYFFGGPGWKALCTSMGFTLAA